MATKRKLKKQYTVVLPIRLHDPSELFLRTSLMSGKSSAGHKIEVDLNCNGDSVFVEINGARYSLKTMDLVEACVEIHDLEKEGGVKATIKKG